jgi:riboflavin kinase/FMN adenylyltransferase
MRIFHNLDHLPTFRNAVVTIGSYDGVHLGHQKILKKVNQLAQSVGGESVVVTFEPHPRLVLQQPASDLALLTTIEEKIMWLECYGVNNVVVVPFNRAFAEQSPNDYIKNFLIKNFNPTYLVVGYDHRFGARRVGDISYLKRFEYDGNFKVIEIEKQLIDDIAVSSTKIRHALEAADIETANRLLNHPFTFSGVVVEGQKIGRTIGFPTANIDVGSRHKLVPPFGIYAVWVWVNEVRYQGMLYRGNRPTLKAYQNITIEVNILDFNQDIYGQEVRVALVHFIRFDKQFDNLAALQNALAQDEIKTRNIFNNLYF